MEGKSLKSYSHVLVVQAHRHTPRFRLGDRAPRPPSCRREILPATLGQDPVRSPLVDISNNISDPSWRRRRNPTRDFYGSTFFVFSFDDVTRVLDFPFFE